MNSHNPAVITGKYFDRDIFLKIKPYFSKPEVIAITGPRQVGKTTLLTHIYETLSKNKKCSFITFENRSILEIFNNDIESFINLYIKNFDIVLIDEFQYGVDAGQKLKYIFDSHYTKLFISGSSSLEIKEIGKYMVGRIFTFTLNPLSFKEFLRVKDSKLYGISKKYFIDIPNLNTLPPNQTKSQTIKTNIKNYFFDYLIYGGFPRILSAKSNQEKELVLSSIIDNYLLREIRSLLKLATENELLNLARFLSLQTGNLISYQELSSSTGLSFRELKKHLKILKETFITDLVYPYYKNRRTELVKNPKVYFLDNGIRNRIIDNFSGVSGRTDIGALAENYVFNRLRESFSKVDYWRTKSKAEVDFIVEKGGHVLPIEVKITPLSKISVGKSLISFIKKYSPDNVVITTIDNFGTRKIGKTKIFFIPIFFIV